MRENRESVMKINMEITDDSTQLHYRINNGIQIDAPKKKGIKEADLINYEKDGAAYG